MNRDAVNTWNSIPIFWPPFGRSWAPLKARINALKAHLIERIVEYWSCSSISEF